MIDNTRATFYLYTVPRTPSLTPPSHQCPSSSSGGMWRARGTRRSAPTRNGARAYRQETHQKTHQKTKLAADKAFRFAVCCRLPTFAGRDKTLGARSKTRRTRQVGIRRWRTVRATSARVSAAERSADTGGERRARVHARGTVARATVRATPAAHSQTSFVRCRASASSFLARRASNADGRRRARARDAGSRTRVRLLRARVARGDDTPPSPRARPRLRNRPAPPQPARPNEKTSRVVPNRCLFLHHGPQERPETRQRRAARFGGGDWF